MDSRSYKIGPHNVVLALKDSQEDALRYLFDTYSNAIYNVAYHVLKDDFESEDVVQEVFVKVWNARHNLDTSGNIWTFIYVATTRLALNKLRNLKFRIKEQHSMLSLGLILEKDCDYATEISEILNLEQQALQQLPEQQRKVYLMSRKDGLSYKEIAEELDISPNTVKNHIVQALKVFRKHFDKFGYPLLILFLNSH